MIFFHFMVKHPTVVLVSRWITDSGSFQPLKRAVCVSQLCLNIHRLPCTIFLSSLSFDVGNSRTNSRMPLFVTTSSLKPS